MKCLLLPFSLLYNGITRLRNLLYDKKILSSVQFSIPVINVGNLSTGGTGKTPHIEYLIRLLKNDYQIATLSRGYKRKTKGFRLAQPHSDAAELGDEPYQFHQKFPEVAVAVSENRITGIPELLTHHPMLDVILLDDAFQHRPIRAGLNLLLTDYSLPYYDDHVLPMGRLREAQTSYRRANIIIITKCPVDLDDLAKREIENKIKPLEHQSLFFTTIKYGNLINIYNQETASFPKDTNVLLITGIANNGPLVHHLHQTYEHIVTKSFSDHHYFNKYDIERIAHAYQDLNKKGATIIITTEKDAMRLALMIELCKNLVLPIYYLPIEVHFLKDEALFNKTIQDYITQERPQKLAYGMKN